MDNESVGVTKTEAPPAQCGPGLLSPALCEVTRCMFMKAVFDVHTVGVYFVAGLTSFTCCESCQFLLTSVKPRHLLGDFGSKIVNVS